MRLSARTILLTFIFAFHVVTAFAGKLNVVFYDNRFGTLDDTTGMYTAIGTLPVSASAGIASMDGLLYLEDMGTNVFTVDPTSGAWRLVGATGLNITAGAFAGGSNGLFELDYASNLDQIDPITGQGHLVGATGLTANNGHYDTSMSSYGSYLYYTAGTAGANDELYRIDEITGLATDLGSTGVTGIAGSGMVNGNLELYQYGQAKNYIYSAAAGSVDFSRGAQLGATIIDGGAVYDPGSPATGNQSVIVPEAGSGWLLGGALLAFVYGHQRRQKEKRPCKGPLPEK